MNRLLAVALILTVLAACDNASYATAAPVDAVEVLHLGEAQ